VSYVNVARIFLAAALAALAVPAWLTWQRASAIPPEPTKVVRVSPRDKATGVDPRAPVQIHFSNGLKLATLTGDAVRLLTAAGVAVPAKLGSDIEGDVVNLQPRDPLKPRTSYVIEVTGKLIDKEGAAVVPFRSSFTTGDDRGPAVAREGFRYTKIKVDDERGPTAIAVRAQAWSRPPTTVSPTLR